MACELEPGWQGSSHPATRVSSNSAGWMRTLDLPRNLRTRARREAPADGPVEVPPVAGRGSGARCVARGDARQSPVRVDLDARRLRGVHAPDVGGPEPTVAARART